MIAMTWLRGLVAHRRSRLLATAAGVAVAVALLASIGTFLSSTTSKMTERAIARVPVDWQVEAQQGAGPRDVLAKVKGDPRVRRALPVQFAPTTGLRASADGSTQTTGAGQGARTARRLRAGLPGRAAHAVGEPARRPARPADGGQPARRARRHDLDRAARNGRRPRSASTASSTCPPPTRSSRRSARRSARSLRRRPTTSCSCPRPPSSGCTAPSRGRAPSSYARRSTPPSTTRCPAARAPPSPQVSGQRAQPRDAPRRRRARRRQPRLGARPGAPGRALRPAAVPLPRRARRDPRRHGDRVDRVRRRATRRRRDAALLRTRGASTRQLVRIALGETALTAGAGVAARPRRGAAHRPARPSAPPSFGAGTRRAPSCGRSAPRSPGWPSRRRRSRCPRGATRAASPSPASAGRSAAATARRGGRATAWTSSPSRLSALVYWQASRNGYSLVLAPEGVPQVSVNWYALLGARARLDRRGPARLPDRRPRARPRPHAAGARAAAAGRASCRPRSRRRWAASAGCWPGAVALVALTAAFAASTAVFNSTYQQQAEADARLTNGADVTVTESPGVASGRRRGSAARHGARACAASSRCSTASPTSAPTCRTSTACARRRSARAGKLQNGWFSGGSADELMRSLAAQPGRRARLPGDRPRLPAAAGRPAAPAPAGRPHASSSRPSPSTTSASPRSSRPHRRDSFFVANQTYVAKAHRQRRGRRLPGPDRRQRPRPRSRSASARGVGTGRPGHRHRQPAPGRRLQPDRRRAVGPDARSSSASRSCSPRRRPGSRSGSASRSAGGRSRSRARSAPRARQLGGFVWSESVFVTAGGLVLGAGHRRRHLRHARRRS